MQLYLIYTGDGDEFGTDQVIIKRGFSYQAACFTALWALYHRMWAFALIGIIIQSLARLVLINSSNWPAQIAFTLVFALFFGVFGTEMQEYTLQKKGYRLKDIVAAKSGEEALLEFLRRSFVA